MSEYIKVWLQLLKVGDLWCRILNNGILQTCRWNGYTFFFSFQQYDWVVNFPLQYFKGPGWLNELGHWI